MRCWKIQIKIRIDLIDSIPCAYTMPHPKMKRETHEKHSSVSKSLHKITALCPSEWVFFPPPLFFSISAFSHSGPNCFALHSICGDELCETHLKGKGQSRRETETDKIPGICALQQTLAVLSLYFVWQWLSHRNRCPALDEADFRLFLFLFSLSLPLAPPFLFCSSASKSIWMRASRTVCLLYLH